VVLGGGPVGIEFGQFLARAGARVTVVAGEERLAPREDPRIGELIREGLSERARARSGARGCRRSA
jgi:pyruvate/2-oxoglutarate dehydrogenase complex dihydrolipoamide dehydrogenase (E3) component